MSERDKPLKGYEEPVILLEPKSSGNVGVLENRVASKKAEIQEKSLDDIVKYDEIKSSEEEYRWSIGEYTRFMKEHVLMKERIKQLEKIIKKISGE